MQSDSYITTSAQITSNIPLYEYPIWGSVGDRPFISELSVLCSYQISSFQHNSRNFVHSPRISLQFPCVPHTVIVGKCSSLSGYPRSLITPLKAFNMKHMRTCNLFQRRGGVNGMLTMQSSVYKDLLHRQKTNDLHKPFTFRLIQLTCTGFVGHA